MIIITHSFLAHPMVVDILEKFCACPSSISPSFCSRHVPFTFTLTVILTYTSNDSEDYSEDRSGQSYCCGSWGFGASNRTQSVALPPRLCAAGLPLSFPRSSFHETLVSARARRVRVGRRNVLLIGVSSLKKPLVSEFPALESFPLFRLWNYLIGWFRISLFRKFKIWNAKRYQKMIGITLEELTKMHWFRKFQRCP